ncbi:MAG: UTP--glucose-1-phosphate uridylyltransferase [Bacteroidales bacterium]|nr:UTP--glucose-1-phosphate uridylyltransferase [Bacteroidales bacterium]MCM1415020.1 UTP--glucose-1-phosphate uridylyltransferase [bacterium]MCM1422874.1 UTP--glucose-1-phosphate uridylyltransferase [bacterium]
MTYREAYDKLERYGQQHVLRYYDELNEQEKEELLTQVAETDFEVLSLCGQKETLNPRGKIEPIAVMELPEIEAKKEEYTKIGLEAIRAGKVGAVLLAGGMGTRLGSDAPKGVYNIGLTKDVFIFQRLVENLLDVVEQAGAWIPLYVMTSDKNHDTTVSFFEEKHYFGYDADHVTFFKQDMAPAADRAGKVYLEEKHKMATSPNGNGGWFLSMMKWGVTDKIKQAGVEWLNVFAVDNVLQRIVDPCFVGATIATNSAVGAKVVAKTAPDEKVGAMCLEDGRPSIVEYYDMTPELMEAKTQDGKPAYNFGVILNYLFRVKDLVEIVEKKLPLHIVEKKIPYINEAGEAVKPEEPNGYKFEQLVLDMIHELDSCLPYEVVRNKEFAPIKNKTGVDSVESARALCKENGIEL